MAAAKKKQERRLVSYVHAFNEDEGQYHVLEGGTPESEVPDWAVKALGDHVWVDGDDEEGDQPSES